MNQKQDPQGTPGGQQDDSGGTRVNPSVPPEAPYVARLRTLGDNELAQFAHELDTAVREARRGPHDPELDDLLIIAVVARSMLRDRRAHAAADRAKDLVRHLLDTENHE